MALNISCVSKCLQKCLLKFLKKRNLTATVSQLETICTLATGFTRWMQGQCARFALAST